MLSSYLEKNREKVGIPLAIVPKDESYINALIKTLGFLMGEAVLGLVVEACFAFEIWEIIETLIIGGLINGPSSKNLLQNLIQKNSSMAISDAINRFSFISEQFPAPMMEKVDGMKKGKKDTGEEDVDIGDEMPESSFPHVEIEKDDGGGQGQATGGGHGNENGGSSSSRSSSSSSSDSSSSSGIESCLSSISEQKERFLFIGKQKLISKNMFTDSSGSSSGSDSDADDAQSWNRVLCFLIGGTKV
ncbi:hypothetical protein LXL04_023544 [Taraxacum kok-saghyz]